MEEKNNMTAERSLEIIRESIERSQRTINKTQQYHSFGRGFAFSYSR